MFVRCVVALIMSREKRQLRIYVCIVEHTYSKSKDQPGNVVANPARGQLNRAHVYTIVRVLLNYILYSTVF